MTWTAQPNLEDVKTESDLFGYTDRLEGGPTVVTDDTTGTSEIIVKPSKYLARCGNNSSDNVTITGPYSGDVGWDLFKNQKITFEILYKADISSGVQSAELGLYVDTGSFTGAYLDIKNGVYHVDGVTEPATVNSSTTPSLLRIISDDKNGTTTFEQPTKNESVTLNGTPYANRFSHFLRFVSSGSFEDIRLARLKLQVDYDG